MPHSIASDVLRLPTECSPEAHRRNRRRRWRAQLFASNPAPKRYVVLVTVEMFKKEILAAVKSYDRHVVCLEKSPEDFEAALDSLMLKAIRAYESRAPGMRHGIALDKQVTIILSQSDTARPLCGIYFNLHSPYQKNALPTTVKAVGEDAPKEED